MTDEELDAMLTRAAAAAVLRPHTNARILTDMAALVAEVRRLWGERDAVYGKGPSPVDQVCHIPLPQFVETRFVPLHEFNRLASKFEEVRDELMAATASRPKEQA